MNSKHFLPGEVLIAESDNKLIVLTSHRLQQRSSTYSDANFTSFMLEKISSIQSHYHSALLLLILGIISGVVGLIGIGAGQSNPDLMTVAPLGIILGAVFIVLYFFSRKHIAIITAECGTKISFEISNTKRDVMYDFLNRIEKAKNERYLKAQHQTII